MREVHELDGLLAENRVVTFVTHRADGSPQMSLVTVGRVDDALAFTTRHPNAKTRNLARDPRCGLLLARPGWRAYATLTGEAQVCGPHNTEPEALRLLLRAVYRAAAGAEHPDWDEYDAVMRQDGRVAVLLRPTRLYTQGL
jgi:PPOX class probable F420-dependent enzyme